MIRYYKNVRIRVSCPKGVLEVCYNYWQRNSWSQRQGILYTVCSKSLHARKCMNIITAASVSIQDSSFSRHFNNKDLWRVRVKKEAEISRLHRWTCLNRLKFWVGRDCVCVCVFEVCLYVYKDRTKQNMLLHLSIFQH